MASSLTDGLTADQIALKKLLEELSEAAYHCGACDGPRDLDQMGTPTASEALTTISEFACSTNREGMLMACIAEVARTKAVVATIEETKEADIAALCADDKYHAADGLEARHRKAVRAAFDAGVQATLVNHLRHVFRR